MELIELAHPDQSLHQNLKITIITSFVFSSLAKHRENRQKRTECRFKEGSQNNKKNRRNNLRRRHLTNLGHGGGYARNNKL